MTEKVGPPLNRAMNNLEELYTTIQTTSQLPQDTVGRLIDTLQKDGNDFSSWINASVTVQNVDPVVSGKIMHMIHAIQQSSGYLSIVGGHQVRLFNILKRIKLAIRKWENKVTKTSKGELQKGKK